MKQDKEVLNAQEAAIFLRVHVETIRRLARKGDIPAFKVGKDWRFRREALLAWADKHPLGGKPPCILVVDNDQSVRDLMGHYLKADSYHALLAPGCAEGLAYLENENVNLILLDLKMPGMNGPEFLHRLREDGRRLPVIVVTGYPESDLMLKAMRYGPITLLAKPIERAPLIQAVRTALNGTCDALAD